jgi:arylformamidase
VELRVRLFDLTHPLSPETAVYPGDPPVCFTSRATIELEGYRVAEARLGTHAGTHVDGPAHFLTAGAAVDRLPLEALCGPARIIALDAEVFPGERLLIRSGWGERWGSEGYFEEFPGLPEALAEALAAAPAALVGLETPSLHPDRETDFRLHRMLLGAGVVIVENLRLPRDLPERLFLTVLPLPLAGLDGAPCRAIAWELETYSTGGTWT